MKNENMTLENEIKEAVVAAETVTEEKPAKKTRKKTVKAEGETAEAPKKRASKKTEKVEKAEAEEAEAAPAPKKTRKTAAKKAAAKVNLYVQYAGKEILTEELVEKAKAVYVAAGNQESDIQTMDVYVKPEDNAAYFAVNGIGADEFKVEL
ncbi:MAG: DUF6465 family protein [bacterium]|nr:DUF6465 family protein [bacterium]